MRYNSARQIYHDCKWCKGRGCLACPEEADKAYKGDIKMYRYGQEEPHLVATFTAEDLESGMLKEVLGPEAIMAAKEQAREEAKDKVKQFQQHVLLTPDLTPKNYEQIEKEIGLGIAGEIVAKNVQEAMEKKRNAP